MPFGLAIDNWSSTLGTAHTVGDGQIILAALNGLPALPAARVYRFTAVSSPGTPAETVLGVFEATGRAGSTLTGVTAAAGYTDVALAAGVTVQVRVCECTIDELQAAIESVTSSPTFGSITVTNPAGTPEIRLDQDDTIGMRWAVESPGVFALQATPDGWETTFDQVTIDGTGNLSVFNALNVHGDVTATNVTILSSMTVGTEVLSPQFRTMGHSSFYVISRRDNDAQVWGIYSVAGSFQLIDLVNYVEALAIDPSSRVTFASTVATGSGVTSARPTGAAAGAQWYDKTLHKPIWFDGSAWRDAAGTVV